MPDIGINSGIGAERRRANQGLRLPQRMRIPGSLAGRLNSASLREVMGRPAGAAELTVSRDAIKAIIADVKVKAVRERSATAQRAGARVSQKLKAKRLEIKATIASRAARAPKDVISAFLNRTSQPAEKRYLPAGPATLIVRSALSTEAEFSRELSKVLGADLAAASITVKRMPLAKAAVTSYSVSFPIAHSRVRTELLNVAWAVRQSKAFASVAVSGLQANLFELEPTAAARAERSFSWHLDLTRFTRAHDIAPTRTGRALGDGVTIAVIDTGWAPHSQYNVAQIDVANSSNVITGQRGGDAARHSIRNGEADAPNISHGTAAGSIILGGARSDRSELLSTRPDADLRFTTTATGQRIYFVEPHVRDASGHLTGAAPAATVLPIKFISDAAADEAFSRGVSGVGVLRLFDNDLIQGIRNAIDGGAHVISLSVGGLMHSDVRKIIDEAVETHNIIIAAAAGQTYVGNVLSGVGEGLSKIGLGADDSVVLPAAYANVIAVAGCAPSGAPWAETHRGPNIDITAPADAVWCADFLPADRRSAAATRGETLVCASGTSFAAPLVASAAALWLAHHGRDALLGAYGPAGKPLAWVFRHVLQRTARALPDWDDGRYGPGILDAEALLRHPLPAAAEVEAPPEMVGALVPFVSDAIEGTHDAILDMAGWLGEQKDRAAEQAALLWAAGEIEIAAAVDALGDAWAQLDANLSAVSASVAAEIGRAKQEIQSAIATEVGRAEEALEDLGDELEEAVELVADAFEEGSDAIGEAAGDAFEAAEDFFSGNWPN